MTPPDPAGEATARLSPASHLSPAEMAALDELARASSRDPSAVVAEAVTAYLELHRWQADRLRAAWDEGIDSGDAGPLDFAALKDEARSRLPSPRKG